MANEIPFPPKTFTATMRFTPDATYDIGGTGFRPRDLTISRNALFGGTLQVTGQSTLLGTTAIGVAQGQTFLNIGASSTAVSHMRLNAGVAPTSPANGDIWFDGTDLKMRVGGVTKTFTLL
jgi:hypothetical protein